MTPEMSKRVAVVLVALRSHCEDCSLLASRSRSSLAIGASLIDGPTYVADRLNTDMAVNSRRTVKDYERRSFLPSLGTGMRLGASDRMSSTLPEALTPHAFDYVISTRTGPHQLAAQPKLDYECARGGSPICVMATKWIATIFPRRRAKVGA